MAIAYNLSFVEKNPNWEFPSNILSLIEIIRADKSFFLVLAKIIHMYHAPDESEEDKVEREEDIRSLFRTTDNLFEKNSAEKEKFIKYVDELYSTPQNVLSKSRGSLLEAFVFYQGPIFKTSNLLNQKYIEPFIMDNEIRVGETDHVFDCVFSFNDLSTEFIECKLRIQSFLFMKRGRLILMGDTKDKMEYISRVHTYLLNRNRPHEIVIATTNTDVSDYQDGLNRKNMSYIKILSATELYEQILC